MPEIVDIEIFYEYLKKLCIKWAAMRPGSEGSARRGRAGSKGSEGG